MMSRYKPVGWRNESHRHYLAAKGIKTKYEHVPWLRTPEQIYDFEEKTGRKHEDESWLHYLKRPSADEARDEPDNYVSGKNVAIGLYADKSNEPLYPRLPLEKQKELKEEWEKTKKFIEDEEQKQFNELIDKAEKGTATQGELKRLHELQMEDFEQFESPEVKKMKFYALKDFLGEEDEDKEAFLSTHKLHGERHRLRHSDIDSARQKALSRLDAAMKAGDMSASERERFIKDEFKSTAQEYLNGHITKDQFDDEFNRSLDYCLKVNRRNLSPFDWSKPKEAAK